MRGLSKADLASPNLWRNCIGAWCPSIEFSRSTVLTDFSQKHNNASTVGNVSWTVRHGKPGLLFDGNSATTEYGVRLARDVFDTSGSFTAHAQFSVDALSTGAERNIFTKVNRSSSRTGFAIAMSDFSPEVMIMIADGAGRTKTYVPATANRLMSVAITYDQTTLAIYTDGLLRSTTTVSRNSASTGIHAMIGVAYRTDTTVTAEAFNGVIFNCMFINRIMGASEIRDLAFDRQFLTKRPIRERAPGVSTNRRRRLICGANC